MKVGDLVKHKHDDLRGTGVLLSSQEINLGRNGTVKCWSILWSDGRVIKLRPCWLTRV